ncbi:vanillyl-alcohol oxidase [Verticillium dahliae VdLs.17]|uniref:Vanillyl-alcohol oxidase n=1 Tax=Verticillium dahliae (strain VdLs.17 / ATCC MYA-4575 / FGSC 10137) TaxID=498257 RepID=G2X9V0_VERDV|nr:vanillyl-alcohol oxidase [Verticillium dahliae VdLs.17]EGY15981.1 vanillyl-alcohol oxidase [Verticillium dahliae VdLs.17]KAH6683787.1 vanillyl-alcohol oxidase [Verticillium dahliae]
MPHPQPRRLSPEFTNEDFNAFVKAILPIVGDENLSIVSADVELCPSGPPLWAATPDTEELHHGPRVPGTLGMELGRHMNQIHEVNVDGAYALVELGVTFFSLYDHLVKTGLDEQLWLDAKEGRFSPKVD